MDIYDKIDLHIHTTESSDGHSSLFEIVEKAKNLNYSLIGITEHDFYNKELMQILKSQRNNIFIYKNQKVIVGAEFNFNAIHVLVFPRNYQSALKIANEKNNADLIEFIELCSNENSITILAHPFRFKQLLKHGFSKMKNLIEKTDFFEFINGRSILSNILTNTYFKKEKYNNISLAGSDSHHVYELGNAFTLINELELSSFDDFYNSLKTSKRKNVFSPNMYSLIYSRYLKLRKKLFPKR
ncbi:MAG: PHP domain-containing protein [Candidatus Anstonellales archaeon]